MNGLSGGTLPGSTASRGSGVGAPHLPVYQAVASSGVGGERHVLFYPSSPVPSLATSDREDGGANWLHQGYSGGASAGGPTISQANQRNSNNNSEFCRMKNAGESGGPSATDPPDSGGGGSGGSRCASTSASGNDTVGGGSGRGGAAYNFRLGIYGWRKRCLYILILGLLVMVIVNLALTLWVLKVMEFSSEGMGQLKIVTGGLRLEGTAYVLDSLIASSIRSRRGQPIVIESSRNLTLTTRDERGFRNNLIFLGNDRFECLSNNFKVMDDRGMLLFSADKNEVVVGSDVLRVTGEGGAIFSGSVQTSLVRAASGHALRLESPTRSLDIRAPSGVHIESRSGDLNALTLNDIKLRSIEGAIRLDAATVLMPSLPTAAPFSRATSGLPAGRHGGANTSPVHEIYQLCACNNGKLFLVAGHSVCGADDDSLICR